jgi:hypothetical protein
MKLIFLLVCLFVCRSSAKGLVTEIDDIDLCITSPLINSITNEEKTILNDIPQYIYNMHFIAKKLRNSGMDRVKSMTRQCLFVNLETLSTIFTATSTQIIHSASKIQI